MTKVFVIDDSVSVCVAVERMLGGHGFDVVWERDAATALRTVEKQNPDLIICDVILPEIDGYDLCTSMRANPLLDNVPVILISGEVNDGVRELAKEADASAVLAKPFTAEQLVDLVQSTLSALRPAKKDGEKSAQKLEWLASELEALGELGCRYACVLDSNLEIVVAIGAADPRRLSYETEEELRWLGGLSTEAKLTANGQESARLTLENGDGMLIVDRLPANQLLVAAIPKATVLGKARFLTRRLRDRMVSGAAD